MAEYWSIIDQRDYCEEADLLARDYAGPAVEVGGELDVMSKWLEEETSTPLVVLGGKEAGKKTLLCAFLRQSKQRHPSWLHLSHFATITPHYAHILYKTMIALRNHYSVQQRVDLNEQKLRRYFKYWLELTSEMIDKEHLGYRRQEVPKVVVVIEGIDQCRDSKGEIVDPEFWLPHQIPRNIKLVLSARALPDKAVPNATILRQHLTHQRRNMILSKLEERARHWAQQSGDDSLYHLQLIDHMVRSKPNFTPSSAAISTVVGQYITAVAAHGCSAEQVRSVLYILALTRKGLKAKGVQNMVGISQQKWGLFLRHFSFFIVQAEGYYLICNQSARQLLRQLVDSNGEKEKTYRQSIAHAIRTESGHLRELEEVVYQLFLCQAYSELKEAISRVQNFALLYTPLSKDLLCQCWVRLEQLQQYDPVFEYNKAIEAYKSHYYPKEEDLYKIIFQLAMFFKEYAEFESARTPEFRHPAIKGEVDQLVEIGIYEELKSLSMVGKCKIYKLKPLEKFSTHLRKEQKKEEKKQQKEEEGKREEKKQRKTAKVKKDKRESDISEHLGEQTPKLQEETAVEPLNIQELNVSIQANQQKFRNFFVASMKEYLENYFSPLKKGGVKEKELSFESEQSDNQEEQTKDRLEKQPRLDVQKLKESLILKKFREFLEQSYHKTGEEVRFYYYKQWIWLQFPWICQTVKHVYSQMIKQCLPGSIHFMSPLQEFRFVREVLKIARTAKESKLNIFTEKKIEMLPIKYSPDKLEQLQMKKKTKAYDECSTVSRTRRTHNPQADNTLIMSLNMVDEMLLTEKKYQQTFREKGKGLRGQASTPNFPTFVTETLQKSKLLPSVSKSKFAKQPRGSEKQNQNASKDFTMIIRKYNEIKHENDMLLQKCQEMRRLSLQQVSKNKEEVELLVGKIAGIEEKKGGLERQFAQQAQLQKKLEVIIKICDLNKMYGSESQYLSTYLASLKEMILLEGTRVKQLKAEVADLMDRSKAEIKELRRKRKDLKTQKEEHDRMFLNLASDSTNMQYKSMPLQEIEEQLREMDRSVKLKNKKERSKVERYFSSEDYELIEEKLGFLYGDCQNQARLKSFADKAEKRRELQVKNGQLQVEIKLHLKEAETMREKIKNFKQASLNEKKIGATSKLMEGKQMLAQVRHRAQIISEAICSLQK